MRLMIMVGVDNVATRGRLGVDIIHGESGDGEIMGGYFKVKRR